MTLSTRQIPRAILTVARTFGVRGTALRLEHELRRKSNKFRDRTRFHLPSQQNPREHPFHVSTDRLLSVTGSHVAVARGERVLAGEYQAYRWEWRPFPVSPADWSQNLPADCQWWKVPHLSASGDIKDVWEPARFAWAYDLVRAFLVTHDDRYATAFHDRLRQWLDGSPPFLGPHWSCGQETAIRAVALLYAEANLSSSPASTSDSMLTIASVLAASAERIADAFGYAVSQRNNHAISEAMGLIVLGARFRGEHPEADRWLARGKKWLERLVLEQFATDGWYIQHSFTYLRLALDQCVVAQRALRASGDSLSPAAVARLGAAVDLLLVVMDSSTGIVPNHGANDGAFVHPITLAEYRDFRPSITAACAIFGFPLPVSVAPDREVLAWLGLDRPAIGEAVPDGVRVGQSGWASARVGASTVFLRAGHYRSRPGHLDPLHVDIRLGGRELVVDPGTFAYNAPPPWRNGLASAHVHNGPVLDGEEPGIKGPRFLWYAWPESEIITTTWVDGTATIVAEIRGRIRRVVRVTSERVVVEDYVLSATAQTARVSWLLAPNANVDAVQVDGDAQIVAATEGKTSAWFSPHYGQRLPTRSVDVVRQVIMGSRISVEFNS
ncbi:MAG: heparinase II/III domain-containing protein [Gemmatimonadaceae bacterium]